MSLKFILGLVLVYNIVFIKLMGNIITPHYPPPAPNQQPIICTKGKFNLYCNMENIKNRFISQSPIIYTSKIPRPHRYSSKY